MSWIETYRKDMADDLLQLLLLTDGGEVLESDDTLFKAQAGQDAFQDFGFPKELVPVLRELKEEGPVHVMRGVRTHLEHRYGTFEFRFRRVPPGLLWQVLDVSLAYQQPAYVDWGSSSVAQAQILREGPMRLLVAEDNPLHRNVVGAMLENMGFDVTVVETGRDLLQCLQEVDPDVVLLDLNMPEMNGYETCQHIRDRMAPPWNETPVVAMSGSGLTERDPGFDAVLKKPLGPDLLRDTVEVLVQERGLRPGMQFEDRVQLKYLRE
ncbi:MAG: response regulator, partial [Bacteroidota bacterium]